MKTDLSMITAKDISRDRRRRGLFDRIGAIFVLCALCVTGFSCAYRYEAPAVSERLLYHNDITSLAVLPFISDAREKGNGDVSEATNIFASELARFQEVRVVHPSLVQHYLDEQHVVVTAKNIRSVASRVGAFFDVQAVVIGTVTEYSAFPPPIFGLSVELVESDTGKHISACSEVYDASFNYVLALLKEYAQVRQVKDSLYKEELLLRRFDYFMRFACYQFLVKYF